MRTTRSTVEVAEKRDVHRPTENDLAFESDVTGQFTQDVIDDTTLAVLNANLLCRLHLEWSGIRCVYA